MSEEPFIVGDFKVSCSIDEDANCLAISFAGSHQGDVNREFTEYLARLISMSESAAIKEVKVHFEEMEKTFSSVQGALFRMLHGLHKNVQRLRIYAKHGDMFQSEVIVYLRLLVKQIEKRPGAQTELIEL